MSGEPSYRSIAADSAFGAILVISFVGTMGTNVLSPALPGITGGLGVADARVGLVLTTFKLSAMLVIPVTSILADLYGRRPVVLPSLVAFGVAGVAMTAADSFVALLALCVLLGAGFAGFMPISIAMVGDRYTGASGSAAQGVRSAVNGLGGVVVPAAAGFLAGLAWNRPFWLFLAVFPVAVVSYVYLPERDGLDDGPEGLGTGLGRTLRTYAVAIRAELTQVDMAVLVGGGFLRDFVRFGVITFVPLFAVRGLDASLLAAGVVLSMRGVASIVVSPTLGVLVAWFSRKPVLVASFAISAAGVVAIPFTPDVVWLGLAFGLYAVGDALASPIVKDTVTDAASDDHRAGVVGGLTVLKNGGQALAPAVFGVVLALASMDAVFLLAAAAAAGYGGLVLGLLDPDI